MQVRDARKLSRLLISRFCIVIPLGQGPTLELHMCLHLLLAMPRRDEEGYEQL